MQIFQDKQGKISSKRVAGYILVVAAIFFNAFSVGDMSVTTAMLWAGIASLGVGTLETRVQK
jgi:small-conductance mechanosensitive channel